MLTLELAKNLLGKCSVNSAGRKAMADAGVHTSLIQAMHSYEPSDSKTLTSMAFAGLCYAYIYDQVHFDCIATQNELNAIFDEYDADKELTDSDFVLGEFNKYTVQNVGIFAIAHLCDSYGNKWWDLAEACQISKADAKALLAMRDSLQAQHGQAIYELGAIVDD